ncbi:cytotoxic and regulatory T-cell molecule [Megalops cyprinoides]|uniref:cytotoxic and regulatory T-cell molecule n=1 Tax=Megalops cyprinoides TaxID=118141 RepID=UPI001864E63E|nr:cytotoxic and regulatory T-cell molecule [Megalops cyprinoides]
MTLRLQICLLLLVASGLAELLATENLTVIEGQTLILRCSNVNDDSDHLEWKNPHGFVIFFNTHKALKDKRYRIVTFSRSEYTISLSDVSFKDGGLYTCLQYTGVVTAKRFKVTVLGFPKLEVTEHDGKTAIKCSAHSNYPPPKISWLFESGLEIDAPPQHHCEDRHTECSSVDVLLVQSHRRRVTVKCVVRHQALYKSHLMNFISIRKDIAEEAVSAATAGYWPSTGSTTALTTDPNSSNDEVTSPSLAGTTESALTSISTSSSDRDEASPSVAVTTELTLTNTSTNSSTEENQNEWDKRSNKRQSSSTLILLVTCLILGLLVVVIFFAIKLRRAHALWKKENEDSEQSLESNKSKSSNEERQSQERRCQISVINPGFRNTNFTKYIVEEPPKNESAANAKGEETPQIQGDHPNPREVVTSPRIRETEL